jgi:hypothetical protein
MKHFIFIVFVLFTINLYPQITNFHIRTKTYGSLRITIEDFKRLAEAVRYYHDGISYDSSDREEIYTYAKGNMSNNNKAITFGSFKDISELQIYEDFDNLEFIYNRNNKPISKVEIKFEDYVRIVSVSGLDERKVQALSDELDNQIKSKMTYYSWFLSSYKVAIISGISFVLIFIIIINIKTIIKKYKIVGIVFSIVIFTISFCFIIITCCLSGQEVFTDFLLTVETPSWIDRNAGMLNIIGISLTIVIPLSGYLINKLKNKTAEVVEEPLTK